MYRALGIPWCPPELREEPFRGEPPALVEAGGHPRRPALPHDVVGRPGERRGDGPRRARARLRVPRDLRPHAGRRRRPGPHRRRRAPPGARRSRRRTSAWRRSACCAGSSATSCPTAGSISPTTCWPSSTGCRRACTAASGCRGAEMTAARRGGAAQPARPLPQPSQGPDHQPPAGERAGPGARVRRRARGGGRGGGQRPSRRGSTCAASTSATRFAAGVRIVCSTDAHSTRSLEYMTLSVQTARRGWATAADVLNTRPLRGDPRRPARRSSALVTMTTLTCVTPGQTIG